MDWIDWVLKFRKVNSDEPRRLCGRSLSTRSLSDYRQCQHRTDPVHQDVQGHRRSSTFDWRCGGFGYARRGRKRCFLSDDIVSMIKWWSTWPEIDRNSMTKRQQSGSSCRVCAHLLSFSPLLAWILARFAVRCCNLPSRLRLNPRQEAAACGRSTSVCPKFKWWMKTWDRLVRQRTNLLTLTPIYHEPLLNLSWNHEASICLCSCALLIS